MIVFNSIHDILLSDIVILVESFTKLFNLFFDVNHILDILILLQFHISLLRQ